MDKNLKDVTVKLLVKIFNTKRTNSIKFVYMVNVNLIECGYELKYHSLGLNKRYLGKGINK